MFVLRNVRGDALAQPSAPHAAEIVVMEMLSSLLAMTP